jgi:hypothetical protein
VFWVAWSESQVSQNVKLMSKPPVMQSANFAMRYVGLYQYTWKLLE